MDTSAIIAVLAVIVVLVVAVLVARPLLRRRRLQERFGPEYDRAVQDYEGRAVAERELIEREKRYQQLELRTLSAEARERYAGQWKQVQAQFVDAPESAVADADRLVTELMAERGYPTEDYEQRLADLSVEHAVTLEHYRAAHDVQERIGTEQVSTEDLRNTMVRYRALFVDLLGPEPDGVEPVRRDGTDATDAVDRDTADVDAARVQTDGRRADLHAPGVDRTEDGRDVAGPDPDAEIADAERGRTGRRGTVR